MNLLRLFEFYLAAMFVIGTARRFGLYRSVARLALALTRRYQRLFGVVKEQSTQLLTWSMILPAALTLVLWAVQSILTRLVFPHAQLTASEVISRWWFDVLVIVPIIAMLAIDVYFLVRVGVIDTAETEKYFRQAEWWLGRWKSKAVHLATFGYVNPRTIVDNEVRKALASGGKLIHSSLWWAAVQTAARVATGLALWLVWAVGPAA